MIKVFGNRGEGKTTVVNKLKKLIADNPQCGLIISNEGERYNENFYVTLIKTPTVGLTQ